MNVDRFIDIEKGTYDEENITEIKSFIGSGETHSWSKVVLKSSGIDIYALNSVTKSVLGFNVQKMHQEIIKLFFF